MDVSIIIINYNTLKVTQDCIESIYVNTDNIKFEVIVVDNASTDGSKEILSKDNRIKYLYLDKNIGFGPANNIGVNQASGEFIFFLNSDTILRNNSLEYFLKFYQAHPNKKLCLGSYLRNSNLEFTDSSGNFPTINHQIIYYCLLPFNFRNNKIKDYISANHVDYIIGADLFIPKDLFLQVGGFDEDFFLYFEETDLQLRLSKIGVERLLIPGPEIIHLEGGSNISGFRNKKLFWPIYSSFVYFYKHRNKFKYLLYRLFALFTLFPYIIVIKSKEGRKNFFKTLVAPYRPI